MKYLAAIFLLLAISAFAPAPKVSAQKTSAEPPKDTTVPLENTTIPDTIPEPPKNIRVDWIDVKPYSFTARWDEVPDAFYYEVQLLNGYTINQLRLHRRVKTNYFTFNNLLPNKVFGIKVRTMNKDGHISKPGVPARTRTRWGTTVPVTTTPKPTNMVPVGDCGQGKFTCRSGRTRCINADLWCDKLFQCDDKSDERGCPGGCPEISENMYANGNFSCSRWGSPRSYCFFSCYNRYERDGSWYFKCLDDGTWSRDLPVCRLPAVKNIELAIALDDFVEFAFSWVDGAFRYRIYLSVVDSDLKPVMYEVPFSEDKMILHNIQKLQPKTQYSLYVVAMSENDVEGMKSSVLNFETVEMSSEYGEYGYDASEFAVEG